MKLVTAIVRTQKLKEVEDALVGLGIPDVTVSNVSGFSGQRMLDRKELSPHSRVDVVLPASQADAVADCICQAACTGLAGDGVILVSPIERIVKIKRWRTHHPAAAGGERE